MKKSVSVVIAFLLILIMLPAGGCAHRGWMGTFNREGDATFARGILDVSSVNGKGFEFKFTVYAGNVAGRLSGFAEFLEEKDAARWNAPENAGYVDFALRDGGIEVVFCGINAEDAALAEAEAVKQKDTSYTYEGGGTEQDILGFAPGGFLTGRFVRGEVEYLNDSISGMHDMFPEEYDEQLQRLTTDEVYTRFMDCFMTVTMWENEDSPNRDKHNDLIGGFIYYGSNPMQEYAAIVICYDDGTVSAVTSRENAGLLYVTNNKVYTEKSDPPLPISQWVNNYNSEQTRLKRAAEAE